MAACSGKQFSWRRRLHLRSRAPHLCSALHRDVHEIQGGGPLVAVFFLTILATGTAPTCIADPRAQASTSQPHDAASAAKTEDLPDAPKPHSPKSMNDATTPRQKNLALRVIERGLNDQRAIWTSPAKLRLSDADWLMPLGIASAASSRRNTETSKHLSSSPDHLNRADNFSNATLGALGGAAAGLYLWASTRTTITRRKLQFWREKRRSTALL